MWRRLPIAIPALLLLAGGCAPREAQILGSALAQGAPGSAAPVAAVRTARDGSPVVVSGRMVEKCPVAGCWFDVRDGSGAIRVDTKNAGFVVLDVPLNAPITVAGRIRSSGGEPQIEAAGVRY